ncbi:MAG: threonine/serine dehydratase [Gammaproteobacteria bacterium]|nr:threonine/serine dehydratase [Gammaproteobacteria bacterium]
MKQNLQTTHVIELQPRAASEDTAVTPQDILEARKRLRGYVRHTPLEYSHGLSHAIGLPGYLKLESMQVTGSFKPRVSFNKLLTLTHDQRKNGVIASTAGGHGIGLSYAAGVLGVTCEIYLPQDADSRKVEVMRRQGARLTFFPSVREARLAALTAAEKTGRTFISAYNDPQIIAGGGTVGLEVLEDLPDVDLLVTGIGGGGLINGMAIAIKAANPNLCVWGVMPKNNPVLGKWLEAGRPVEVDTTESIADGLGAHIETDSITFTLGMQHINRVILVSEQEIKDAMRWLLREHQLIVEPSGAAPVAALLKIGPQKFNRAAVVITGRNISADRYLQYIS